MRPLVSFDVPGCREIVRNGENGVLVKQIDAESLALGLISLISDRSKCKAFGKASRAIVVNEFSSEAISRETIEIWENQIVNGRFEMLSGLVIFAMACRQY